MLNCICDSGSLKVFPKIICSKLYIVNPEFLSYVQPLSVNTVSNLECVFSDIFLYTPRQIGRAINTNTHTHRVIYHTSHRHIFTNRYGSPLPLCTHTHAHIDTNIYFCDPKCPLNNTSNFRPPEYSFFILKISNQYWSVPVPETIILNSKSSDPWEFFEK